MSSSQIGRRHRRPSLLTSSQQTTLVLAGLGVALAATWHLAMVLLAGVPLGGVGTTLKAAARFSPLNGLRPQYDPPAAGVAILVWLTLFAAVVGVVAGVVLWSSSRRGRMVGTATRQQARQSAGEVRARDRAKYSRRASIQAGLLDPESCDLAEVGWQLGTKEDDGEPVVFTLEDQVGVFAPTGGGKSLHLMIPLAIDAPGPLVATATQPEILDAIVEPRSGKGRIWVFDPLDLAGWPEPMLWNPVAAAGDSERAVALGQAFTSGVNAGKGAGGDTSNQFFQTAAAVIIARLFHAAALSDRPITDVISWALDLEKSTTAQDILTTHKDAEIFWARTLKAATEGHDDTLASVRMTLAQKVDPLLSRKVLRQMIPQPGLPQFDPIAFVQSTDTLILITDDQADTNVAPLTTMLLNEVIAAGKKVAARSMSLRLDPPLRIVGDEIANVAPIPKLPGMLSNVRGMGIQMILALQSMAQVRSRWGEVDGEALMSNLNLSMALGGLQDTEALDRFSDLVGSADVVEVSTNLTAGRSQSGHTLSSNERSVMQSSEVRRMDDGKALVIYRNAVAMIVDMVPWYARPDGDRIGAGIDRTRRMRIEGRS